MGGWRSYGSCWALLLAACVNVQCDEYAKGRAAMILISALTILTTDK